MLVGNISNLLMVGETLNGEVSQKLINTSIIIIIVWHSLTDQRNADNGEC